MRLVGVAVDPVDKVAGLCVDTGEAGLGAPVAPGHNTGQLAAAHEGSTGVTLNMVIV